MLGLCQYADRNVSNTTQAIMIDLLGLVARMFVMSH